MAEYIERKARYIDAYSLKDKVLESKKNNPHRIDVVARSHNCEHEHFLKMIADEPTADVVEVVRCKDCEYRYVPCHCALWYGTVCGKEYFIERGDDFFCSYGKRKEGAEGCQ